MKRAVIFCNGDRPIHSRIRALIDEQDFIICADGGARHALRLNLIPDVVVGDFDSLPPRIKKKLSTTKTVFIEYPKEKDETDSELALSYAVKNGYVDFLVIGMVGSRIDHMLATLLHYASHPQKRISVRIVEENQDLYIVHTSLTIMGNVGEYVSLIPLLGDAIGIVTRGLKYALSSDTLSFGSTRGISNEFTSKTVTVSVTNGILLVVHTRDT